MPLRRLDPRVIDDLSDVVEERILERVEADFRSEIEEVKATFRFEMALMKSDMIIEIISAIGGVPQDTGTKDGYEEAVEDFEFARSSGEAKPYHVERPMGNKVG